MGEIPKLFMTVASQIVRVIRLLPPERREAFVVSLRTAAAEDGRPELVAAVEGLITSALDLEQALDGPQA